MKIVLYVRGEMLGSDEMSSTHNILLLIATRLLAIVTTQIKRPSGFFMFLLSSDFTISLHLIKHHDTYIFSVMHKCVQVMVVSGGIYPRVTQIILFPIYIQNVWPC